MPLKARAHDVSDYRADHSFIRFRAHSFSIAQHIRNSLYAGLNDAAIAKPPHKTFHERETDEEVVAKRRIRMEPFSVNREIAPLSRLHRRSAEARQEREDPLKLIKADIPWEAGAACLKSEVSGNHRDLVREI